MSGKCIINFLWVSLRISKPNLVNTFTQLPSTYYIFSLNIASMLSLNPHTNSNERQIVLHADMDAFFASMELRERSQLKGLPVVVGADPKRGKGRGIVCTCSYEAREYGIHSAMPVSQAYKLCPDAAFLPVNMELYKNISANVMEILKGFAEKFE